VRRIEKGVVVNVLKERKGKRRREGGRKGMERLGVKARGGRGGRGTRHEGLKRV